MTWNLNIYHKLFVIIFISKNAMAQDYYDFVEDDNNATVSSNITISTSNSSNPDPSSVSPSDVSSSSVSPSDVSSSSVSPSDVSSSSLSPIDLLFNFSHNPNSSSITTTTAHFVVEGNNCDCNEVYEPLCGNDDKSYFNKCYMQCEGGPKVSFQYWGKCLPF